MAGARPAMTEGESQFGNAPMTPRRTLSAQLDEKLVAPAAERDSRLRAERRMITPLRFSSQSSPFAMRRDRETAVP